MAVMWTFREPSLGRRVPHEFMRNAVLNLTLIIPATACHQRNYVQRYRRCNQVHEFDTDQCIFGYLERFHPNIGRVTRFTPR